MKKCPSCKLTNPDTAQLCDCGYNFETAKQGDPMPGSERRASLASAEAIYHAIPALMAGQATKMALPFLGVIWLLGAIAIAFGLSVLIHSWLGRTLGQRWGFAARSTTTVVLAFLFLLLGAIGAHGV